MSTLKVTFKASIDRLESFALIMQHLDKLVKLGTLTVKLDFDNGPEKGDPASLAAYKKSEAAAEPPYFGGSQIRELHELQDEAADFATFTDADYNRVRSYLAHQLNREVNVTILRETVGHLVNRQSISAIKYIREVLRLSLHSSKAIVDAIKVWQKTIRQTKD